MMKNNLLLFKIFLKGDSFEKRLLKNHLLAIIILIGMVFGAYLIITHIINTQKDGAELINKSGKQRMLTQRVLTYYYQNDVNFDSKIEATFENIELNNQYLLKKLQEKKSISYEDPFLKTLYFKQDGILESFKKYKQSIIANDGVQEVCYKLFNLYEEATVYYESLLTLKMEKLLYYEIIILILSISTIILEGFFIFRPALIEVYNKHRELRKLNEILDFKVKEQINKIREQEQTLIQQSKMAEMGEMLSDISHQWKQPLTILSMQLETIQLDIQDGVFTQEQINSDFEECFKLIKHMHQTIEDFKNFYKPDTDKKVFNLIEAISDVIKMEKTSLNRHTINLNFDKPNHTITILGFEGQFKQVILTLINNAIEQISNNIVQHIQEKNSGKIEIKLEKNQNTIVVKVSDNAGGIDPKIVDKIFNPYFSTKHNTGGSGIGLYMAKTILERNFSAKLYAKNISDGASFEIVIEASA